MALVLLVACRGDEPKRMPDTIPEITGTITTLTQTDATKQNIQLQIIVTATDKEAGQYPQASIKVLDETLIETDKGKRVKAGKLREGQLVNVWFNDGVIAESMPVQVSAKAIKVNTQP